MVGILSKPSELIKSGIVIDRCCVTLEERLRLLNLMHNPSSNDITVIFFNKDIEDCKMEVCSRKNHPTITKDKNGRQIVDGFYKKLVPPNRSEGYGHVEVITSHEESENYLKSIGIKPIEVTSSTLFVKFPRTPHLLDAGGTGVTRDDLVMSSNDAQQWIQNAIINVEEKIDGSNLGISLSEDYLPLYQNRSHFINSASATQWRGLDRWWNENSAMLTTILQPNRHILFGEWCAIQHSIHYTSLPSYFIAFDIYDIIEKKFYSRNKLIEFLEPSGIPIIHTITRRQFDSPKDILPYLDTISIYGARSSAHGSGGSGGGGGKNNKKTEEAQEDAPVEGVYLRVDDGDWLDRRCKIVGTDFIQGIEEHWLKRIPIKNLIKF
jgi:atypical dual specificity phosphatase